MERVKNEGLAALRRQIIRPLLEHELQEIRLGLKKQIKDSVKLGGYLDQVMQDVLDNLELFQASPSERGRTAPGGTGHGAVALPGQPGGGQRGADGCAGDHREQPLLPRLFGSIEYQAEEDVLLTDFSRIRAGSLLKAHGGFLMLHLRDLLADELVWEKLRRFSRSGRLQIEEPGTMFSPMAAVSLEPEAVDVEVKIVLIGATEQYYVLQEADPEFARRFRVKVDFAESFAASAQTYARLSRVRGPHLPAPGLAAFLGRGGGASAGGGAPRGRTTSRARARSLPAWRRW